VFQRNHSVSVDPLRNQASGPLNSSFLPGFFGLPREMAVKDFRETLHTIRAPGFRAFPAKELKTGRKAYGRRIANTWEESYVDMRQVSDFL
jgi:hypothetical protein